MALNKSSLSLWLLLPAVTMSLGWALRGFIGGGPLGAMIPGALVALILAVLLELDDAACGLIAAYGAVGIGFGGQETYGQTVGLSFQPETFWWAILGFAVKGAVWGLLGGAVMGMAFVRERFRTKNLIAGCGLMVMATYAGWKLINEPKLIYFSNRLDRPREELYAGLLFGALVLLGWLMLRGASKIPLRFALWGGLGGGVGFAAGAWIQVIGRGIQPHIWVGWWKVMELTFGALLGLAFGFCAWRYRAELKSAEPPRQDVGNGWWWIAAGLAVIAASLVLSEQLPTRLPYTILGAGLLCLALLRESLAWQTAITMTCCAFFVDVAKGKSQIGVEVLAVAVMLATVAVAACVARWPSKRAMLMLLMWVSVGVALLKLFVPPMAKGEGPAVMGGLFVVMALVASRWAARIQVNAAGALALALLLAPANMWGAQPLSDAKLDWTVELGQPANGGPVHFGPAGSADGVLLALGSGKIVLISPRGETAATMELDLQPACAPVSTDGKIFAADVWGSLYAFDSRGKRLWKHERFERAGGGYNYLVLADLDGDGSAEMIMTSSRGKLYAVDARGRLRLEVHVTNYRVSTPAVGDIDGDGRPELVFASDDSEIYAVTGRGELLWSRRIESSRFGRALPLIADINGDGRAEVLIPTPFVGLGPGLYALDGVTGRVLWKAPSKMQSYNSTVLADLNGDGRKEILYGDKNTRLHAVDGSGQSLWNRQLDGRGIFFAPVVADLGGDAQATVFQVVRGAGANGKSLYALNGKGEVVDALAIEGGGASSAALMRFKGDEELKMLVASASGKLYCYRLPQRVGAAKVLWQGVRNDAWNSGFVAPAVAFKNVGRPPAKLRPGDTHIGAREVSTDGAIRVRIIPSGMPEVRGFERAPVRRGIRVAVRQIANPWPTLREAELPASPSGAANRVDVAMLGNEYESAAIAITNLRSERSTLRLESSAFVSDTNKSTPAKRVIEFREVPLVLPESTGKPVEDVLPALGEGQLVWLGPKETRKIWLTLRSRDLDVGMHRATLKIGDLLSVDAPLSVPVGVRIHAVRLPDKRVYRHGNWLYLAGIQDPELRDRVIQDALEHGTNVFNVPSCSTQVNEQGALGAAATEPHDTLVKALRGKAFFMIGGSVGLTWPKGFKPDAALEQRAYAEAIRWYAAHMKSLGVDYREWAFYTMDEPGLMGRDASWERWVEGVKRIKAADAKAQIYANPAGGARADLLSEVANLVDVWQPDLHQVREQPVELAKIFSKGQYWHYEAPGDQRNLDPLGYYRMKPWVAFQMGMTGGGYWVYQSSSYWFFDRNLTVEYGTVYPTDRGPVTTKRWEASRDGAEDFELLWLVRESARVRRDELGAAALKLVDEAVGFVTKGQEHVSDISRQVRPFTPDFNAWIACRAKLIDMAERLQRR